MLVVKMLTSFNSLYEGDTMVYAKLAAVFTLLAGVMGMIFAINSMLSGNEVGAGVLLAASALAFGLLLIAVVPRNDKQ